MLYRPNFCCHCGEKITHAYWTPLTSRRFCDFCAVEQKQHDLLPRATAVVLLLIGAAGLTAYFGSGSPRSQSSAAFTAHETKRVAVEASNRQPSPNGSRAGSPTPPAGVSPSSSTTGTSLNTRQLSAGASSLPAPVYHCGAITKKGTPCTRRVKSPGHCWQHIGHPTMRAPH